jgi:O-methyltransferase involved in polyketide biosynthesis
VSARVSPTAHYTSYVWFLNGMSHPALATRLGRSLHAALRPMNLAYERFSASPSLDMMLLARHLVLDHLLERAIRSGAVGQVLEVAAGLSPRGFRFAQRFPDLVYVEADLPAQADRKRAALDGAGLRRPRHEVVALDALADAGDSTVEAVAARHFDPGRGLAIVTEGLLGYFDRAAVEEMWRRFARCLSAHGIGLYLSDLNLAGDVGGMRGARAFRVLLSAFARGRVHLHYRDADEAAAALRNAGFAEARLHLPGDFPEVEVPGRERRHVVRVVEARARRSG